MPATRRIKGKRIANSRLVFVRNSEGLNFMARYYYASTIKEFLQSNTVLQTLCQGSEFDINLEQRDAWQKEIGCAMEDLLEK